MAVDRCAGIYWAKEAPGGWARSASPASSPARAIAQGNPPQSCSGDCAPRPRGGHKRPRKKRTGETPCFRWWPPSSPSSNRSGGSTRGSPTPCAHPDGEVFLSLFRDPGSTLTAAKLLCEIGDQRERYPTAEALAADAGMCPVAKESGKRKVATFRRACNKRLRYILATLADSSRQHNPWAKDIYLRARWRGCDHPHAIRVLGRAWVRVIWRMWQDGVPYDPLKHSSRRRLNAA